MVTTSNMCDCDEYLTVGATRVKRMQVIDVHTNFVWNILSCVKITQ